MTSDKSTTKTESTPKAAGPPSEGGSKLEGNAPSNYTRGEKQKSAAGAQIGNTGTFCGASASDMSRFVTLRSP